jgi:hypothetical protein
MEGLPLKRLLLLTIFMLQITTLLYAQHSTKHEFYIFDSTHRYLKLFQERPELIVDHLSEDGYELYGPDGLDKWLEQLQISYVHKKRLKSRSGFPRFAEIEQRLHSLHRQYPKITSLFSIGESEQGRKLWVIKISDNVTQDEKEPEFKYIANMHGNEIVGRDLMLLFIADLLKNYGSDPVITQLVNTTEIYIMPSMNPDGSELMQRGNASWSDLNRSFPDFTTYDNQNTIDGRPVEVQAVMQFQTGRNFSLSANFHGGAVVVNYPWDTTAEEHSQEELVKRLSLEYAEHNSTMWNSSRFENGIVRGSTWYEINGGMQDWSYHWHQDLQVTVELSYDKWPEYDLLDGFYQENRESLLTFLGKIHQGINLQFESIDSGSIELYKLDSQGKTLIKRSIFTGGEYHKVLPAGSYQFIVKSDEQVFTRSIDISEGKLSREMLIL